MHLKKIIKLKTNYKINHTKNVSTNSVDTFFSMTQQTINNISL